MYDVESFVETQHKSSKYLARQFHASNSLSLKLVQCGETIPYSQQQKQCNTEIYINSCRKTVLSYSGTMCLQALSAASITILKKITSMNKTLKQLE